jgi:predicted DNA-binding transcriptional regulator AlpA
MPDSPLLTPKQLSEITGISIQRLATMRMDGTGCPFIRLGSRAIRYERTAVEAWIKANTYTSTDEYSDQPGTTNKKPAAA